MCVFNQRRINLLQHVLERECNDWNYFIFQGRQIENNLYKN